MILQALTQCYADLLRRGEIAEPGWGMTKISYALCLDGEGRLTHVTPLLVETTMGKKTVLRPRAMRMPAAAARTVNIESNFLWDNSGYLLGVAQKGTAARCARYFAACRTLHHELLDDVDSPVARAILSFLDTWDPALAAEHPALSACYGDVISGVNLVFRVGDRFAQEDAAVCAAWQRHCDNGGSDGVRMQCLVTGREDVIPATHPMIKGVKGAQTSGAALVSFNAQAFCSYGREQNFNAPVGREAALSYTAALNHLLSDYDTVQHIGDATVVCWAQGADPQYARFSAAALFGGATPEGLTDDDLHAVLRRLANGLPCEELGLDPQRPFYILGLAPNAARLSVRFFLCNTFGDLMRNVNAHHERLEIVGLPKSGMNVTTLYGLLRETVNLNARSPSPSPVMAGATARAIFSGGRYPTSLLEATMLRIRAERRVTPGRAAILKAYYLKNTDPDCPKEVLTVSLNENSTNVAYTLGRLFSVYEAVQQAANPGINATIKDKYFDAASSTPAAIFPVLGRLSQKHLRKLKEGQTVYFDKQIAELKGVLGEEYPLRLNLAQQGSFDLGYYHQTQKRYTKKEEN